MFENAPALATPTGVQGPLTTALVNITGNTVPDKINCCAKCANYYNCIAWRFIPVYVDEPTDRLPGGFDPWGRGSCEIAYYTGNTTSQEGVTYDDGASVCPNGRVETVLNGTNNAHRGEPHLEGLYYNGWNNGACGGDAHYYFIGGSETGEYRNCRHGWGPA
jgi:hypothetical protein